MADKMSAWKFRQENYVRVMKDLGKKLDRPPLDIEISVELMEAYHQEMTRRPSQTLMTLIPAGTCVFEPDGIHQVTLQFKAEDDAILFYEAVAAIGGRE